MAGAISNERPAAAINKDDAPKRVEPDHALTLLRAGLKVNPSSGRILNFEEDEYASFGSFADGCLKHLNFG